MKLRLRHLVLALTLGAVIPMATPQGGLTPQGGQVGQADQDETHLPNGKLQRDEILKTEHEQNIKDAAKLAELSQQLQVDIEKNDRFVLSLDTLKKTDEIEKLAKRIRSRLRHY
jgi:hypothetical protein